MQILFICRFLPHPDARDSGSQDKFHYIASLSQEHEVSLIAFVTKEQNQAVATMRVLCQHVEAIPYNQNAFLVRLWREIWRWLRPRIYGRVFSFRYHIQLQRLLKQHSYDVAIVDGPMASYGMKLKNVRRVLDEVDIYSTVAYHLYQNETRRMQRIRLYWDWVRTFQAELCYVSAYDGIFVRSLKDKAFLQEYLQRQRIAVLSPWFEGLSELQTIPTQRPNDNNILFMGSMNIPANIEAVVWFAHNVLPRIQKQLPDATFTIVGSSPSPAVMALGHLPGVRVIGEVADLTPYYAETAVNVVPLFTGGGIIVKTLNGMAAGRPTVTTNLGNSGTGALPEKHLLVVDATSKDFADAVIRILNCSNLWQRLAIEGRNFIQETYNWQTILRDLNNYLTEILQK